MRDYKKYDVWERAHQFTLYIYKEIVPSFPKSELYGLVSQLKRSAYSIPLNIVEGCGRNTDKDFVHFLDIALGSVHETEYCCLLASDLGFIEKDKCEILQSKTSEIKAKLNNLIKSIRKSSVKP